MQNLSKFNIKVTFKSVFRSWLWPLTIFIKGSIIEVWKVSKCVSELFLEQQLNLTICSDAEHNLSFINSSWINSLKPDGNKESYILKQKLQVCLSMYAFLPSDVKVLRLIQRLSQEPHKHLRCRALQKHLTAFSC